MKRLMRTLLIVAIVLMVPIVPFLLGGPALEKWLESFLHSDSTAGVTAATAFGLLASDIFLPVPSSVVATGAGGRLGILVGTTVAWCGMSVGTLFGYAIARRWGRPVAARWMGDEQWQFEERLAGEHGVWLVVGTRGVPVVAEAMVLLAGMHAMPLRQFMPAVLLSNLGIAIAYTALGSIAARQQWLPIALGIAAAFPLLLPALLPWARTGRRDPREQ